MFSMPRDHTSANQYVSGKYTMMSSEVLSPIQRPFAPLGRVVSSGAKPFFRAQALWVDPADEADEAGIMDLGDLSKVPQ